MAISTMSKKGMLRQALSLANLVTRMGVSTNDPQVLNEILCLAAKRIHDQHTKNVVLIFKPKYTCFYENIVKACFENEI